MNIVIIGGIRGIGFALAKQFLLMNNNVVISGTKAESVGLALNKLKSDRVFNILADKPEEVTAFLSEKVLKNTKDDSYIAWLTTPKIIFRFLFAHRRKNKFFKIS